jgi:NADPH-dependent 2,4-dienoyl-CoA reductase/sulfur reductase-like enzyme
VKRRRVDVVVVGAGPAGIAAAVSAARGGAHVGVLDDNPAPGGQIWRRRRAGAVTRTLSSAGTIALLSSVRAIAPLGSRALIAESPVTAYEIGYDRLIIATGSRERFLPFPGWTLPGVTGAGGLQALVKGGLPIDGKRVVVAGSGPLLLAVAAYLKHRGARIRMIAEQTPIANLARFAPALARHPAKLVEAGDLARRLRGVRLRAGCWPIAAHGRERVEAVTLHQGGRMWTEQCDYLACGFGLVPSVELAAAFGCGVVDGAAAVDRWQATGVEGIFAAGEVTGIGGVELALVEGQIAGLAATGQHDGTAALFARRAQARHFAAALEHAFRLRDELRHLAAPATIICRCEDVSYAALSEHTSWRGAKLHTRCGMGPCQGRVCGAASAFLFGWTLDSVRPPVTPARLESLVYTSH